MPGYSQMQRAPAPQKSADGGAASHARAQVAVRDGATASHGVLADALNESPRTQSLLQMRRALEESPRVQSQLALQRALNRSEAAPANEAWPVVQQKQRRVKPTLQAKGMAIMNAGFNLNSNEPLNTGAGPQPKAPGGNVAIQRKFAGHYGDLLTTLSPGYLNLPDSHIYSSIWTALNASEKELSVDEGTPKYDEEKSIVHLKGEQIRSLTSGATNPELRTAAIAVITHELSHAHDHLIKNRTQGEAPDRLKHIIDTEWRAWAREAKSAAETAPLALDDERKDLIAGWQTLKPELLNDVGNSTNKVIKRLVHYIQLYSEDIRVKTQMQFVQGWVNANKEWLADKISWTVAQDLGDFADEKKAGKQMATEPQALTQPRDLYDLSVFADQPDFLTN
jgi:hypothetical protein